MSPERMSLIEQIERNEKILRAEYQRGFIAGSEKTRKDDIEEFLEDLKLNHPMIGFKYTREELIKKWEDKK